MSNNVNSGGIGFCSLLTLIFIALKLAGIGAVATWSWWWVLSPLIALCAIRFAVLLAVFVILEILGSKKR